MKINVKIKINTKETGNTLFGYSTSFDINESKKVSDVKLMLKDICEIPSEFIFDSDSINFRGKELTNDDRISLYAMLSTLLQNRERAELLPPG